MVGNDTINKVNKDINVANLIEQYIKIFPKGRDFKAVCPFHDDTNPSMSISIEKNIWKCFSCGVGGKPVDFVIKYEKVDLLNALKIIEKKMNYKVENLSNLNEKKYSQEQLEIFKINEIVKDIYANFLTIDLSGADARKYLYSRHFTKEDIVKYSLGYASDDFDIYKTLIKENIKEKDIFNSMLVNQGSNKYYNFFEDRIIFPIFDVDNRVVGFSGRIYKKNNDLPKYINIKENQIFQKKDILYNLNRAKICAQSKKEIFITEGFTDVFSMEKVGIENVVCTMGTALTKSHIKSLVDLKINNLILFFDGDNAGVKATLDAIKLAISFINVFVVNNITDKDPNELVQSNQLYEIATSNRISWFDFIFKYLVKQYNLNDAIECDNFINTLFSYIYNSNKKNKIDNIEYFEKIAIAVNKSIQIIESKYNFYKNENNTKVSNNKLIENLNIDDNQIYNNEAFWNEIPESKNKNNNSSKNIIDTENYLNELVYIVICTNKYNSEIKKCLNKIINPLYRDIVNKIILWYDKNPTLNKKDIIQKLKDENIYEQVENNFINYENIRKYLYISEKLVNDIIKRINIEQYNKKILDYNKLIIDNDFDLKIVNKTVQNLTNEINARKKLKKRDKNKNGK